MVSVIETKTKGQLSVSEIWKAFRKNELNLRHCKSSAILIFDSLTRASTKTVECLTCKKRTSKNG